MKDLLFSGVLLIEQEDELSGDEISGENGISGEDLWSGDESESGDTASGDFTSRPHRQSGQFDIFFLHRDK